MARGAGCWGKYRHVKKEILHLTEDTVVSTQQKKTVLLTPCKMEVGSQTELLQKDVMVQVTGYSLFLVAGGSVGCEQVEDLLSCTAELQGEVEMMQDDKKSLGAFGRLKWRIVWWSQALLCLEGKWEHLLHSTQDGGHPVQSLRQVHWETHEERESPAVRG